MPPIHLSSTFRQLRPGDFQYEYARTKNPSRDILEKLLAAIESGEQAFAFSSGMAAIATVCDLFGEDYHVICSDDVYGGTRRLFDKVKTNINYIMKAVLFVCRLKLTSLIVVTRDRTGLYTYTWT